MKEVTIILTSQLKDASDKLSKAIIGLVAVESMSKSMRSYQNYLALWPKSMSMLDVEKEE